MNYSILDIETDGLLEAEGENPAATKIHCISVNQIYDGVSTLFTLIDYDEMKALLAKEEILVGHNIIRYDVPVLEKLLGIKITSKQIDTLGLSWYLYPNRLKHGLELWGEDLGIEKPKILDWSNQSLEDYIYRCEQDVQINTKLFDLQNDYLIEIYKDSDKAMRLVNYLMFKLQCAREQEEVKWKLDVSKCLENLAFLQSALDAKTDELAAAMPPVIEYKIASRPKVLYKKDGTPSSHGAKWLAILEQYSLPSYHIGAIKIPDGERIGNPRSHAQLKSWLFGLGWKPDVFKYIKEEDGTQRAVPQISTDDGSELSDSVKALFNIEPKLELLDGYFKIGHRIGILKAFLENKDSNDFLKAEIGGFTNTLRFQHKKPIVNLPTIPKLYWEKVRGCLIAPNNNHILCGSDMSGLEDNTKRHYMYYYDPEYVKEQMTPDFDAHLDIAVLAGMLTTEQSEEHKLHDKTKGAEGKSYKAIRGKAKKVNFAGVYGAGPPKIALTGGFSLPEAKLLHTTYWKRNWSVKTIANNTTIKIIGSQMWLLNPVSQLWYSLRYEKDKFSTLNQGTGVYAFDSWVRKVRQQGVKNCGQFHDEIISPILKGTEEEHKSKLQLAISQTNAELQLNVELRISIDFGNSYAEIH